MNPDKPLRELTFADFFDLLVKIRDSTGKATDDALMFVNFCLSNVGWSHAQHLQDLWVAYESKSRRNGYFVEFGAMDGITWSNTYALEQHLGWNGIVAEPARMWYPAVANNRACGVDTRCVWTKTGETLKFNQTKLGGLSTIDDYSSTDLHAHHRVDGERYDVPTVSLTDLLRHWNAPRRIDYLSIDTEGSELDILQAFDWDSYDIRLFSIEHAWTERRPHIREFMAGKGYIHKFEQYSQADDWFVRVHR